jgi:hypothetical protein
MFPGGRRSRLCGRIGNLVDLIEQEIARRRSSPLAETSVGGHTQEAGVLPFVVRRVAAIIGLCGTQVEGDSGLTVEAVTAVIGLGFCGRRGVSGSPVTIGSKQPPSLGQLDVGQQLTVLFSQFLDGR